MTRHPIPRGSSIISDKRVLEKTGRSWEEWFALLDEGNVISLSHADAVKWLEEQNLISHAWWQQTIIGEYEIARSKREVGENEKKEFQASTQKIFDMDVKRTWDFLVNHPARTRWLGTVNELPLVKGATFTTEEGLHCEVRGVKEENYIRLRLIENDDPHPTTLTVSLIPSGDRTSIRFMHQKLRSQRERMDKTGHWASMLRRLFDLAENLA